MRVAEERDEEVTERVEEDAEVDEVDANSVVLVTWVACSGVLLAAGGVVGTAAEVDTGATVAGSVAAVAITVEAVGCR